MTSKLEDYIKEKKEWEEAFEKAKKMTGNHKTKLSFEQPKSEIKGKITIAKYFGLKNEISVNTKILNNHYSLPKDVKLAVIFHEFGHRSDHQLVFPILYFLTGGIYMLIYKILNRKKKLKEFIADKYAEFVLKTKLGKKGSQIFKEYMKYFEQSKN